MLFLRKIASWSSIIELLKQRQHVTYSFVDQALMLFLLKEKFLDVIAVKMVQSFVKQFVSYVHSVYQELYRRILQTGDITESDLQTLKAIAQEFATLFLPA